MCFFCFSQEKQWNYSGDVMDQVKINGETVRRLKGNVRFIKKGQVILTDNAEQHIKDDVLYMKGNTIMINGLDTLTCDSMIYWSNLDSGYAMGEVKYVQLEPDRKLSTEHFHYWKTNGFQGSSFITDGFSRLEEEDYIISAHKILKRIN